MLWEELCLNKAEAGREFNERCRRSDGVSVVENLGAGMIILRDILYFRLHQDVERLVGEDSMYIPVSESRSQRRTKGDIEVFQVAESAAAVKEPRSGLDADWFATWLLRFHHGQGSAPAANVQMSSYLGQTSDARRLAFTDVLAKVFPESRRAPLVLFRLFPLAVQLATFLALGDRARAEHIRVQQVSELAAVGDCKQCHGKVLDNSRQCPVCGNPLWKSELLMALG
jgi:hypothetical protein